MYQPTVPVLYSEIAPGSVGESRFFHLYANGTYVRNARGETIQSLRPTPYSRIEYGFRMGEDFFRGAITDKILVERITTYFEQFYLKRDTNCAALANFLTTGTFIPAERGKSFVLEQGMRRYRPGQRVDVGDMVCLFYANKDFPRSRKTLWRQDYMNLRKERITHGRFGAGLETEHDSYTSMEIRKFYHSPVFRDFHFLVCVDRRDSKPVWISQRGYLSPNDEFYTPVVLTIGEHDAYYDDVSLLSLIKKRRN